MVDSDAETIPEMITDTLRSVMRELAIPGEPTEDVLTFALDVSRDDFFPEEFLPQLLASPQSAAFCRTTAARLFTLLRAEPVEDTFVYVPAPALSSIERRREVYEHSFRLSKDFSRIVAVRLGAVWKVKYSNHEFVVVVKGGRPDLLQSFQGLRGYGVGRSVEFTKSLRAGEVEYLLATMAAGGVLAERVHEALFGQALNAEVADVFAFEKASLASDLEIVSRLRERMYASLGYYKELARLYGPPSVQS